MVHQVAAHGVVQVHHESDLELGTHAVDARNQNGLAEFLAVDGKHAAETANLAHHTAGEGPVSKILDALFGAVSAVNVDSAVGVGDGRLFQFKGPLFLYGAGIRCGGESYFSIALSEIPSVAESLSSKTPLTGIQILLGFGRRVSGYRSPSATRRDGRRELLPHRIQYPVNELHRLGRRELARNLQRLIDHHGFGCLV